MNKRVAAGSTALPLYVPVMRSQYSRHYPHGLSRSAVKLPSPSCASGFFRECKLPRAVDRVRDYGITGLVPMFPNSILRPVLAAAGLVPINRIRPMRETSAQDQGTSKIWLT